ncbi:MAG: response regulator [Sphingobacteriales bacterium]|nr:MAG: response regulator [Sphingobacteriales bacterium]
MILIVDDDIAVRTSLELLLSGAGNSVLTADNPLDALSIINQRVPQLILLDLNFSIDTSGNEGMQLLKHIRAIDSKVPIILITGWASIELAVKGMKLGANDFINKPWNNEHVLQSVGTLLNLQVPVLKHATRRQLDADFAFHHIIGEDPEMLRILETIAQVAATDASSRFGTIAVIMWEYLRLLVFPHPLSWDYSFNQIELTNLSNPKALVSIAAHIALLGAAIYGLRKKKIWSYCILFYFATMSVYSNLFVPIHATVAERFLFSPSLGFCLLIAYGIFSLLKQKRKEGEVPGFLNYGMLLVMILTTAYTFKTVDRNKDWKDSVTISRAGAIDSPKSARTHSAYGSSLMQLGERSTDQNARNAYFREALAETKVAIDIYPHDINYIYNFGVLSYYLNDTTAARKAFAKAVEMDPEKLNALFNLAATYETAGNHVRALHYYQQVQKKDSAFQNVTYSVANSAIKQNMHDLAIVNLRAFLRHVPSHADAHNVLGVAYYNKQQLDLALHHFNQALRYAPNRHDIYANAASVYYSQQQYAKAAQYYEQALKYNPGNASYTSMLTACRRMAGIQ